MKISVIGTGNMGSAIATGLLDAGHQVTVYNRTRAKTDSVAARGASVAATAADAINASEFSIVALFDAASTRKVLLDAQTRGVLAGRALSSIAAMTSEEMMALDKDIAAAGGVLSDVVVCTYPDSVEKRQSEFILACAPQHAAQWRKIFSDLGPHVHEVGAVGNGAKAQLSMWLSYMFMTIAMAYSVAAFEKLGLPLKVARDLLSSSPTLAIAGAGEIVPEMAGRSYGTGRWSVDNMVATIDQVIDFATSLKIDVTAMKAVRETYARAAALGYGASDVSALYEAVNPRTA